MTDQKPQTLARVLIESARDHARISRDIAFPGIESPTVRAMLATDRGISKEQLIEAVQLHMEIVMDCFLTGAAMMLKALHQEPECLQPEWKKPTTAPQPGTFVTKVTRTTKGSQDDYDHETRLEALFNQFGIRGGQKQ